MEDKMFLLWNKSINKIESALENERKSDEKLSLDKTLPRNKEIVFVLKK